MAELAVPEHKPAGRTATPALLAMPEGPMPLTVQRLAETGRMLNASPVVVAQRALADRMSGNRTGLPDALKSGIESLSGMAMDDVRVHRNSDRPAQLQAHAFAQGADIHLAPGQDHHLPHEVWHVVQQKQGRVAATTQLAGVGVNTDEGLEQEADRYGALASRGAAIEAPAQAMATAAAPAVAQRAPLTDAAFLASLGLSEGEIKALSELGDSAEEQLLSGIYYGGLEVDGDRKDQINAAMSASTAITENQAAGLASIAAFIVGRFPTAQYSYIGLGRSPVLIIEYLKQRYNAATFEMPIGGLSDIDPNDIVNDLNERVAFEELVDAHVGPQAGQRYVIIDYAENGGSIESFQKMMRECYPGSVFEIMPVFLNEAKEASGAQGEAFEELRDGDANVEAFVKRLRLEIGKAGLAGFEKFDVSQGIGERSPVPTAGGAEARRALVADL